MPLLTFLTILSTAFSLEAGINGLAFVKSTVERYQSASAVEINVRKKVTLALLEETKESKGVLLFSKGKMRLEIEKPEESLIVMSQNAVWVVTPTSKELGGKTQVLKIRSGELAKQSKAPLAALLGKPAAWDELKVEKETEQDGLVKLALVPKKANALGDVVEVSLEIRKADKTIKSFGYKDDLDNETLFEFEKTNFKAKPSKESFRYIPPRNAEVTEY